MNRQEPNFVPTELFDMFWRFAYERQMAFIKRFHGENPPWTSDKVLQEYKFTNAYRFLDRVSQYLIQNIVNNRRGFTDEDIFFRIILFKMFNKIETWEYIEKELGTVTYPKYNFELFDKTLTKMMKKGKKVYSAAYIMPSGVSSFGYPKKHENNLKLIEQIMNDRPIEKIRVMKSLEDLYLFFLKFPTIGNFLAYQYSIDINYSHLCNFSEMDFIVPGPGAIRGIKKCFKNVSKSDLSSIIEYVTKNQKNEFEKRGFDFPFINGRMLHLVDIQNLFCEIDKYSRQLPKFNTNNGRIKQKFKPKKEPLTLYMPKKWIDNVDKEEDYYGYCH